MEDVQHDDTMRFDAIENQIVAVNPASDVKVLIAADQRKTIRQLCQSTNFPPKFAQKAEGARRIITTNMIADCFHILLSFGRNLDPHSAL